VRRLPLLLLVLIGSLPFLSCRSHYPGVGYGMCVNPNDNFGYGLSLLKQAGFDWAKVQIRWEERQGAPGAENIDWGFIDNVVNTAQQYNVKLLFSVVTAPRWARPADTDWSVPGPPANPQDYAAFVGAIAARHPGKVKAYEIWNEQNLWYEWGGKGRLNAGQYVDLLRAAYAAIKAADPDAMVISGGLTPTGIDDGQIAYDDLHYLQMMYDAGVKDYCDAVGAHPGGYNNAPGDDPSTNTTGTANFKGHRSFYFRRFEQYHEVMNQFWDGYKQIWFTEFGWASAWPAPAGYEFANDNSEQEQADFLVQAYSLARSRYYVGPMMVWNLNYAPAAEPADTYAKAAFSLLRRDWSPRPAYWALANMFKPRQYP
jgi:hypothetical protein